MTFGSLFAGIGGFDLGFERAGMTCSWQVEINEFCRRVLAKHWPDVRRHDDVKTFPPTDAEEWRVDVICGGFPCQDASKANARGAGIDGDKTGLWVEYARILRGLRPRFAVLENVPALVVRGFERVLGDLAEIGFDAEWSVVSGCAMGAPHARERLFVVAYPAGTRLERSWLSGPTGDSAWRTPGPAIRRVAHGVSAPVDRLSALGNSIVPQVAEWIGRRLVNMEAA
jgi:DNA (cytosine-5)-methyltransferase 1